MFNMKLGRNGEAKAYKTMAKICPYNEEKDFDKKAFTLEEDDADSGWYFECKICDDSKCSGYIRK